MIELLTTYTLIEILVFVFIILAALKEGWSLIDFFRNKMKKHYEEEASDDKKIESIIKRLDTFEESLKESVAQEKDLYNQFIEFKEECKEHFQNTDEKLELLKVSDKDSIKSWIVEKHHCFVKQRWIDDFNMDAIEKRFAHYVDEGGNSYVLDLVQELRKLPNYPPL